MSRQQLREWRRTRYLSQPNLAELLGVSTNTVNRWEVGETKVPSFLHLALETLDREYNWARTGPCGGWHEMLVWR